MRKVKNNIRAHNLAEKTKLLTEESPFLVQEAYKTLRTNVMFSLPGSGCKCVGITSPTPGDGKSTTASNLAIALAQINKRVLLIDCDMRLPSIATKFQIVSKYPSKYLDKITASGTDVTGGRSTIT